MARRWREDEHRGDRKWLLTYLDLCTLLFSFFVLLVSMSTIDHARKNRALGSIETSFGGERVATPARVAGGADAAGGSPASGSETAMEVRDREGGQPEVLRKNDQVIVELRRNVLFDGGAYAISAKIEPYLGQLAAHLKASGGEVEIEGHTDVLEGTGEGDARNRSWETSMRRAEAVYRFLADHGVDSARMRYRGFSHYRPAETREGGGSSTERDARVDIVLAPGVTLPRNLQPAGMGREGPVNYKNFFFKLYPVESAGTGGTGERRP